MQITLNGREIARAINASGAVPGAFAPSRIYDFVVVRLMSVGCPKEIKAARENVALTLPIVIEKNRKKYGYIPSTDYWPAAMVVAGGAARARLMSRGILNAAAWVERGALSFCKNDVIDGEDIARSLSASIQQKFSGYTLPLKAQRGSTLLALHPFECYAVAEFNGRKFGHSFSVDAESHRTILSGTPVDLAVNASVGMPRVSDGERSTADMIPLASNQVSNRGALTSDLFTQVIRNFANIDATVATLLNAIKFGLYTPMQPSFYPVSLSADHKILTPFIKAGIAPVDVLGWASAIEKDPALRQRVRRATQGRGSRPEILWA